MDLVYEDITGPNILLPVNNGSLISENYFNDFQLKSF